MPLIKNYEANDGTCQVTFVFSDFGDARSVHLVAEFNGWDRESLRMKKVGGDWTVTVALEPDSTYQYRYLVNGNEWYNDDEADDYVAHPYGGENSMVVT
jgi:1,4-alpha-glucan branching enzyme